MADERTKGCMVITLEEGVAEMLLGYLQDRIEPLTAFQCRDCEDVFAGEAVAVHAEPGRCPEWSNHGMERVSYKIVPAHRFRIIRDPKEA